MIRSLESEAKSIKKKNKTPLFILASRKKKAIEETKFTRRKTRSKRKRRSVENHCIIYPSWPVHGFEARQSAALSFSPDIYSARQSGPINFPDYIEPIVTRPTSTARWIYPQGCSSSSSTSPPPLPLFKFNFSAECIESTLPPERHLVSFSFSSFSSFLESLSPHLLREEIFVFFLFFFRMLEKKFFCFEFHYSKRYRRARDLPRVFKKTVTSR